MKLSPWPCPRGTHHPKARLSAAAVRDIRTSKEKRAVLAKRYGISVWTVADVRAGKSWAWVSG